MNRVLMNFKLRVIRHNRYVSSTISPSNRFAGIRRPDTTQAGTIVWLGSEVMFFAGLFAILFTLRATASEHFAHGQSLLNVTWATIITVILVTSSITAQMAVFKAEEDPIKLRGYGLNPKNWGAAEWYMLSVFLGILFIAGQTYEYAVLVSEGITFSSDPWASAFFLTTGFHGLHVIGGIIAMLFVVGRIYATKVPSHKEATTAIVVSYYWHFVDVVWIGLYFAIYWMR